MRLTVVTTSFPADSNPASGLFLCRLLTCLPSDMTITVVTPKAGVAVTTDLLRENITVKPFAYMPSKWHSIAHRPGGLPAALKAFPIRSFFLIAALYLSMLKEMFCRTAAADMFHAQWAPNGLVAGIVGKCFRKPVITTFRGTDVDWARRFKSFRFIIYLCLLLSNRTVAVSKAIASQLVEWFPSYRHKISVIPNGVDFSGENKALIRSSRFTAVFVGNLVCNKAVDDIIRAFAMITQNHADARLLIVGDGPEKSNLHSLARQISTDRQILFLGQLNPDDAADFLTISSVLILASKSEGRPNVVLEAMAAGVPVIAGDIDGVRELIGDNERGLLFEVGNVGQLARHMETLFADEALGRQLAASARAWLESQNLTWENAAAQYTALYREVLEEHRKGHRSCVG